ncbi:hypothetical protein BDV96DRAFT_602335 [Lophiotrema nucula]|uniref:Uncharacterized protein n=1 Tax=Lophiotrema nucula TaxID=690887 RepID=A0A6A5Z205_9PLEO|nr:hypothetical protein BDV96DRAFT_602335 [Lophiotrema nucula]
MHVNVACVGHWAHVATKLQMYNMRGRSSTVDAGRRVTKAIFLHASALLDQRTAPVATNRKETSKCLGGLAEADLSRKRFRRGSSASHFLYSMAAYNTARHGPSPSGKPRSAARIVDALAFKASSALAEPIHGAQLLNEAAVCLALIHAAGMSRLRLC